MYEVDGLQEGIKRAKLNIDVFKKAIDGELATITEYKRIIRILQKEEQKKNVDSG